MKKFILIFLLVIVGLFLVSGIYLLTFDVNSYKGTIEKMATEAIGRPVSIQGKMSLDKSFRPTLVLNDVVIDNDEKFKNPTFATIKQAKVHVNLQALFQDIFQVEEIFIEGAKVYLEVNEKNQNNWTFETTAPASEQPATRPTLSKKVTKDIKPQIDTIGLSDVTISYTDLASKKVYEAKLDKASLNHMVNFDVAFTYNKEPFVVKGSVKNLMDVIKTGRHFNFTFDVKAYQAQTTISGNLRDLKKLDNVTFNLKSKGANLNKTLSYMLKDVQNIPAIPFDVNGAIRLNGKQILADGAGNFVKGGIKASFSAEMPNLNKMQVKGRLNVEATDAQFLKQYGIKPFTYGSAFELKDEKTLALTNVNVMADETDLDGTITVVLNERPEISGELHSRYFKLDNVLADTSSSKATQTAQKDSQDKAFFSETPLNVSALQKVDLQLNLNIENVYFGNFVRKYPSVLTTIVLKNGELNVALHEGTQLANGLVVGSVRMKTKNDAIDTLMVKMIGEGLEIKELKIFENQLKDGLFSTNINLSTQGKSVHELVSQLKGQVLLLGGDSQILNPWIEKMRMSTFAVLQTILPRPDYYTRQATYLKCFVLNLALQDGIIYLDKKAALETNFINMIFDGTVDLKNEKLNVQLIPMAPKGKTTEVANIISQFILIKGTFLNPSIGIDTLNTMKTVATAVMTSGISIPVEQAVKKATEDDNPCETALKGARFQTINDYYGRKPQVEVPPAPSEPEKPQSAPSKAVQFGTQLLDSLSNVLTSPIPPSGSTPQ